MRGKGKGTGEVVEKAGITPAHAGKSVGVRIIQLDIQDHPRTCGEKRPLPPSSSAVSGSPPHMRGKALAPPMRAAVLRITPAHAGKRLYASQSPKARKDHPRTCGEKAKYWMQGREPEGSPPHMRGKVRQTYAMYKPEWDHPRTCGEKGFIFTEHIFEVGSPPHMRGKD